MIKLKQLLKEIRQAVWRVPGSAPTEVINVLHRIVAVVLKKTKGKPVDFDKVFRLHDMLGEHWMVENRVNKKVLLTYNGKKDIWALIGPPSIEIGGKMYHAKELNPVQLSHIITSWID